jgi:Zn-finger nucleic acid-binding protein
MEIDALEIILLDLKYCERCGGLWLRPRSCEQVLCASCLAQLSKLHQGWEKHNLRRLVLKTTIHANSGGRKVPAICGKGGNA